MPRKTRTNISIVSLLFTFIAVLLVVTLVSAAAGTPYLVVDINSGGDSEPNDMTVYNGELYFRANDGSGTGDELWKYDGTTASLAADINSGGDGSPNDLAVMGSFTSRPMTALLDLNCGNITVQLPALLLISILAETAVHAT